MAFTDIKWNMVQWLPAFWQPYAILMRLDRPIGWWLLLLPGWMGITLATSQVENDTAHYYILLFLFLIGAIIMRGAGCVINDIWDRDLDRKVERTKTRPLASGQVNLKQALIFLVFLLSIGLFILMQTSPTSIAIGIGSVLLIISYPLMKRITWWPQAFLGMTFNLGVLIGWAAITNDISLPALMLYIGCIFWTIGYDTIYAHQDKDDDVLIGIKSTALLFGDQSKFWVSIFYSLAYILIFYALYLNNPAIPILILMGLPALHLIWQIFHWQKDDQASSLFIFKSNRDFGLMVFLIFILSTI